MQNHYNHKNRCKYNLKAHIVLVTKYRKTLLQYGLDDFVKRAIIYLAGQNNWTVIAMETDKDHIHILWEYDTTERVCDIISILKRQTTYYLWNQYGTYLSRQYWKKHIFWSDGYFACSIGEVSSATIEKYIAEQG
jgi:putative transposase